MCIIMAPSAPTCWNAGEHAGHYGEFRGGLKKRGWGKLLGSTHAIMANFCGGWKNGGAAICWEHAHHYGEF